VLGYIVRMQMLSKVFFNIISYSLSTFPKPWETDVIFIFIFLQWEERAEFSIVPTNLSSLRLPNNFNGCFFRIFILLSSSFGSINCSKHFGFSLSPTGRAMSTMQNRTWAGQGSQLIRTPAIRSVNLHWNPNPLRPTSGNPKYLNPWTQKEETRGKLHCQSCTAGKPKEAEQTG